MLYKVEGIVIRSMDYGEGNKIISLFTRETGKMSVMARGAKKLKSRHSAITQLFTYGQYVVYKSGQMGTLNAGEIIDSHHKLRENLHAAAYSSYLAEMYDKLMGEMEPNAVMFEQLLAALKAIEENKEPAIILHIMEMKMLALSGYSPELSHCVSCGTEEGDMVLSAGNGGVLCRACKGKDPHAVALSEASWKLLRLFQRVDLRRLGNVEVKQTTKAQLKQCMRALMDTYLDLRWKSRHFLDQMDKFDL